MQYVLMKKFTSRNISKTINHMLSGGQWAIIAGQQGANSFNADGTRNPKGVQNNLNLYRSLKDTLRSFGYGFIDQQIGLWLNDRKQNDLPPIRVPDDSLFVPQIDARAAREIGEMFGQEQVIVGNNGFFSFVGCKTGKPVWGPNKVRDYFEHIDETHPDFNINHTNSDGDKWRFADPTDHHKNKMPQMESRDQLPLQSVPTTAMKIIHQAPTHYFYSFLAPIVRFRPRDGISVATDLLEASFDSDGLSDANGSTVPIHLRVPIHSRADDLAVWLPLVKLPHKGVCG